MKKYLFRISSAVLFFAGCLTAMAEGQLSEKTIAPRFPDVPALTVAPSKSGAEPIVQKIRKFKPEGNRGLVRSVSGPMVCAPAHAPAKATADIPALRGMVVYNSTFTDKNQPVGLYDIGQDGNRMFVAGPFGYGGVEIDGIYYVHYYGEFIWTGMYGSVYGYDLQTGEQSYSSMDTSPILGTIGGLAKDPTTGDVYAVTFNNTGEGHQLTKFSYPGNYVGFSRIAEIDTKINFNSIACDKNGQLYAITFEASGSGDAYAVTSSSLVKIDKVTAEITVVGETGQLPHGASGAVIDPKTNRMFWTVYTVDGQGYLCEVDLVTGAATKLYDFVNDDEVTGLCIPEPVAQPKAPAKPLDFVLDFPRGSMKGTVSFKVPSTYYDGTAADGEVSYTLKYSNYGSVIEGKTTFGSEISIPVTNITWASTYSFEAYLSNEAGKSPKVFAKAFVGRGVPKTPAVEMTRDGNKISLAWEAVTESADGGFIDPDSVTYTVRRYVNETSEIIADSIEGITWIDEIEESENPTTLYYTVMSHASVKSSPEAKTKPIVMGSVTPPYLNELNTPEKFAGFTVVDVKGDGKTWELYKSYSGAQIRCNYSYSNPKDDWLFTPPVNLEAGKAYKMSFATYASYTAETVEAKWGTEPSVEGMDGEILAPTTVKGSKKITYGSLVIPEADGRYYLGLHAMTTKSSNYLYVADISVEEVDGTLLPGVVTDLSVTPDAMGALQATISFKAPTVTLAGSPLEALDSVIVKRDGVQVGRAVSPAPGAPLNVYDSPTYAGNYVYSVQAFTPAGGGRDVTAKVFVGVNRPASPMNVVMEETSTPGELHFSWEPVTTDIDGNPLSAELITYSICIPVDLGYAIYYQPVYENIKDNEYTCMAADPGKQTFVQYVVCAKTTGGLSQGVTTPLLAVGTPYEDVHESFSGGYTSYAFNTTGNNDDTVWILANDQTLNGFTSQDGDNGYLYMAVNYIDYYADLTSAKIRLPVDNAAIQFYVYKFAAMEGYADVKNTFEIFVREVGQEEFVRIGKPVVVGELPVTQGWVPIGMSLADYAGKTVQVRVRGNAINDAYNFIDNLRIGRIMSCDASVSVSAPARISAGQDYTAVVTVCNEGYEDVEGLSVRLFADGAEIGSSPMPALHPGVSASTGFYLSMHALAERPVALVATVELAGDQDIANNTSAITSVTPKVSPFPAVTDLAGQSGADGKAVLSWSEPDLDKSPAVSSLVDFEDAESFATSFGDWVFVDVDQQPISGIYGISMPVADGSLQSFWIHDRDWEGMFNESFGAVSGSKYLASMMTYSGTRCDDWAITPTLCGEAQDVAFWAKSYHPNYPERMEVYYSTGSTDPKDFVKVGSGVEVPSEWTRYVIELPVGAKRMAIRKCSVNGFMLFVDDVEFAAEGAAPNRNILGYDTYRDAVRMTSSPVVATTWADAELAEGEHEYVVVAVYDRGISRASNVVRLLTTGINEIGVPSGDDAEYYNLQGFRVNVPVSGNIYIRRHNGMASKVYVR